MSDLKEQLIKLGNKNPRLRKHLRPVLDSLSNEEIRTMPNTSLALTIASLRNLPSHIPSEVVERAESLYKKALRRPESPGDVDVVRGWWIETHTLGCHAHHCPTEEERWNHHWDRFDELDRDSNTFIDGDPGDGVFVAVSLQTKR